MWIVLYGSPTGGFKAFGPFPTEKAAADWGEDMGEGGEWTMEVHAPETALAVGLYPWDQPTPAPSEGG